MLQEGLLSPSGDKNQSECHQSTAQKEGCLPLATVSMNCGEMMQQFFLLSLNSLAEEF